MSIRSCFRVGKALPKRVRLPVLIKGVKLEFVRFFLHLWLTTDGGIYIKIRYGSLAQNGCMLLGPFVGPYKSVFMSAPTAKDNCSPRSPICIVQKWKLENSKRFLFGTTIAILWSRFIFPNTRAISIIEAVPLDGSRAPKVQASRWFPKRTYRSN